MTQLYSHHDNSTSALELTISILEDLEDVVSKTILVLKDKPEWPHLAVHHLTLIHSA